MIKRKADRIYLKGVQDPLQDCFFYIVRGFLVVAKDEEDPAPTWYNVDQVERLEGVRRVYTKPQQAYDI